MFAGFSGQHSEGSDLFEEGYAEDIDCDVQSPLERASTLLVPKASLVQILSSIKKIPLPEQTLPDSSVVLTPPSSRRLSTHFSESEIAMLNLAVKRRFTRETTKDIIKTVQDPSFNPQDISSDIFAKIDREDLGNMSFEVTYIT